HCIPLPTGSGGGRSPGNGDPATPTTEGYLLRSRGHCVALTPRGNAAALARIRGSSARSLSHRSVLRSTPSARGPARSGRPPRDSVPEYACRLSTGRTSVGTSSRDGGSRSFLHE